MGQPLRTTVNQAYTVTPQEAASNTFSAASPNNNRGQRQYTVSGLDNTQKYDIVLFPAENVSTDEEGVVTFTDAENSNAGNDVADWTATTGRIEVVNGASVTDVNGMVVDIAPVNGTIQFTIDAESADSVVPVIVQADTNSSDGTPDLDLDANNQPTENFAIGGAKTFVAPEAGAGDVGAADETVNFVDKDGNSFSTNNATPGDATDDVTYFYDANDIFQMATADEGACNPVSLATFESNLSRSDELDHGSIYAPDPEAVSTFCLEDINPAGPANVTAAAQDSDTIRVTWDTVTDADSYNIYRVQDDTPAACSTTLTDYTKIATVAGTATRQYDDNGLSSGTGYCYTVTSVQDGDESGITDTGGATTATAGSTVAPLSTDAYIVTDDNNEVGGTDSFRVVFNEQMSPIDVDDRIQVTDAEGDLVNLYCGGLGGGTNQDSEVACTYNTADVTIAGATFGPGRVLTVTLLGDTSYAPDNSRPSGDNAVDYPATVTASQGITDLNANEWNLADSTDKVIDNEGTKTETGSFAAEAVAPDATAATVTDGGAGNDTGTVTYNEAVICNGSDPGQFVYDADTTDGVNPTQAATAVTCDGDNTITLTFPTGTVTTGAASDAITYTESGTAANRVRDFQGNTAGSPDTVTPTAA